MGGSRAAPTSIQKSWRLSTTEEVAVQRQKYEQLVVSAMSAGASQQLLVRWCGGLGSPRPHMHVRGETPTVGFFQWATIEAQSRISNRFQIPRNRSRETEGKVRKMSQQITNCEKHIPKTRTRDFCHGPEFSFPSFQNSDQSQQITKCAEHIPSTQKIPYAEFCRLLVKWQISKTKNGTSQSEMGCVD